jgi:2-polyprenyl-3-methyl-5-hydroxy-6-metoxy-1,4-benzoquinol methylase
MFSGTVRLLHRLHYLFLLAPRGYGKPIPKDTWELQYQQGYWNYLYSLDEMAHYMVIVGYVQYIHKSPTILDVGCGHGRLLKLLHPFGFASYLGIDLSAEALKQAEALGIKDTRFEEADFTVWEASSRFNLIVFNEALVHAKWPAEVLLRYGRWLEKDGSIIMSMFRYGNHRTLWKNIGKYFATTHATTVKNAKGMTWDIRVLQPKVI